MPDHLGIDHTEARMALIMGTPERVPLLAAAFDRPVQLTDRRGYLIYEAGVGGHKVLLLATGIGGPSTAIAIEELVDLGVELIIRVGTCGSLHSYIRPGDLVISSGAVRAEGTSKQYIDPSFPAIPDPLLLGRLLASASAHGIAYHLGITHCKDAYYLERPNRQLAPEAVALQWGVWRNAHVLATEMEAAVLFVLGSIRAISTAALLINVGKIPDPHTATLEKIAIILNDVLPAFASGLPQRKNPDATDEERSFND